MSLFPDLQRNFEVANSLRMEKSNIEIRNIEYISICECDRFINVVGSYHAYNSQPTSYPGSYLRSGSEDSLL